MRKDAKRPRGRLLRVAEVARRLDCDPSTVYRKVEGGELPALQLGGCRAGIRVDEAEFERWLYGSGDAAA